ncbi:MAG TPA: methanogenesis marker protein Mmp4/MtxX [Methanocorpusculum sp.]|jgi:putative methanogen marker protein 4|nr:methanogenesis marker protein Mmp4/MtxX [Methanocorpusculum sp.]MEE1136007.1 methanogenesis marker protein Mmp4/MtxX [Methanocorpusculum sp.]HJJ63138.1 methanogenesis marker protein Mmp4/MtxX [Methanocorpusculum sp.]HJJ68791.1 methanogenesis marker protein Mmp4/MtxX [Methanocorpusculum sp.]
MKIGIGCGVNPEKVIQSAGKSASPDVEIICYVKEGTEFSVPEFVSINYSECPEKSLVDDLYSKKIDAAVRGSLPANDTLKYLKKVYDVSRLERIALLETSAGQKFFFAPVGVDEGWTVSEKVSFVEDGRRLARAFGLPDKAVILSGGRLGDIGRHEMVDRTIYEAEEAAEISGAVHGEILIEDAVSDAGVIIAPDGISGNLIFRTLVFLGGGIGHGALIVNIKDLFIDSSRASASYEGILSMAKCIIDGQIH